VSFVLEVKPETLRYLCGDFGAFILFIEFQIFSVETQEFQSRIFNIEFFSETTVLFLIEIHADCKN
jgi:hypothetical protein